MQESKLETPVLNDNNGKLESSNHEKKKKKKNHNKTKKKKKGNQDLNISQPKLVQTKEESNLGIETREVYEAKIDELKKNYKITIRNKLLELNSKKETIISSLRQENENLRVLLANKEENNKQSQYESDSQEKAKANALEEENAKLKAILVEQQQDRRQLTKENVQLREKVDEMGLLIVSRKQEMETLLADLESSYPGKTKSFLPLSSVPTSSFSSPKQKQKESKKDSPSLDPIILSSPPLGAARPVKKQLRGINLSSSEKHHSVRKTTLVGQHSHHDHHSIAITNTDDNSKDTTISSQYKTSVYPQSNIASSTNTSSTTNKRPSLHDRKDRGPLHEDRGPIQHISSDAYFGTNDIDVNDDPDVISSRRARMDKYNEAPAISSDDIFQSSPTNNDDDSANYGEGPIEQYKHVRDSLRTTLGKFTTSFVHNLRDPFQHEETDTL